MKLLSLTLDNFKGAKHFDFRPDGHSVVVKAANGVGKTTLEDAYWWLLTGKNAEQSTDFDIYPYGSETGVEASVSGVFKMDDGTEFSLRRTYKTRAERRRGDAEITVRGNKTEFYINDVPKAQKDFVPFVSEHFGGDDRLLILSKLHYFPVSLKWDTRRQTLIDLFAPHLDDVEIIKMHEELAPLGGYIGAMTTVADYAQQAKLQRRKINDQLREIPARIDEAEKSKPALPADADPAAISKIAARRQQLRNTVSALTSGESTATLRRNIAEKEAKSAEARAVYIRDTTGGNENLQRQAAELRRDIAKAELKLDEQTALQLADRHHLENSKKEIQLLRDEARKNFFNEFDESSEICEACGRPYPPDQIEKRREDFNIKKAKTKDDIDRKGKSVAADIKVITQNIENRAAEIDDQAHRIANMKQMLSELVSCIVTPPAWETTTDARAYAVELNELREQLSQIDALTKKQLETTQMELDSVEAQYSKITSRTAIQEQIERIDARIQALQDEEKKLGIQLAQLDNRLLLTERFVQLQAADVEDKINASFRRVRWVLFGRQVNGGIAPCCRATVDGADYEHNVNTAGKYNGGLDIIDGLSRATGLRLPVWIDNAESVTNYDHIENQVIRLQVSAEHPEITVEVLS